MGWREERYRNKFAQDLQDVSNATALEIPEQLILLELFQHRLKERYVSTANIDWIHKED